MTRKESDLSGRLAELHGVARRGRESEVAERSPDFQANISRLLADWERDGRPALAALVAVQKELGPDFDQAMRMDFAGLVKGGIPKQKAVALEDTLARAQTLLSSALEQLKSIPGRIAEIRPDHEASFRHGCKRSDEIRYAMRGVIYAASDVRVLHALMLQQISEIERAAEQIGANRVLEMAGPHSADQAGGNHAS